MVMKMDVYNWNAEKIETIEANDRVFGAPWKADLVHQVVESLRANRRVPYAHAKGRGEVRGGGKKPWRQKGTGRARHGSTRSPIWVGGGVTHGPTKEKIFEKKINKKMRRAALFAVLSKKAADGEILVLEGIAFPKGKTKEAALAFKRVSSIPGFGSLGRKGTRVLVTPEAQPETLRALRNLPGLSAVEARNLNVFEILSNRYLILKRADVKTLERLNA